MNFLFLGGSAAKVPEAHPVRPLVRSGKRDPLFLGGSAAGPYAHSYGAGKGILCSCDLFYAAIRHTEG